MAKTPDEKPKSHTGRDDRVVDKMLSDLGVDDEMKRQLVASGRMTGDIFRVETSDQVRRQLEIEKSIERLRDSVRFLERDMTTIDTAIDRIERDLIPVVLSFLVGLKGNLVTLKGTVVSKSKSRSKTNLQSTYVDTEVRAIVDEEFSKIEGTLTSGMSTPILEKIRELTEGLNKSLKTSVEELTALKGNLDDYTQRSSTEVEFLAKEISMKPRIEVPKDVAEQLKALERQVEELKRDLGLTTQKIKNRESEIQGLQSELAAAKTRNQSLEETVTRFRSGPVADAAAIVDLRQTVRSLEASRDLLNDNLDEANKRADEAEGKIRQYASDLAKTELNLQDALARIEEMAAEISRSRAQLAEIDGLRAAVRSYESGDKIRELERVKNELDRASAALERLTKDNDEEVERATYLQKRLEGYTGLMQSTEKTKAFLMLEDVKELSLREIGKSMGVAPAIVMKWAEDFQRLGIAKLVDGKKLVLTIGSPGTEATKNPES